MTAPLWALLFATKDQWKLAFTQHFWGIHSSCAVVTPTPEGGAVSLLFGRWGQGTEWWLPAPLLPGAILSKLTTPLPCLSCTLKFVLLLGQSCPPLGDWRVPFFGVRLGPHQWVSSHSQNLVTLTVMPGTPAVSSFPLLGRGQREDALQLRLSIGHLDLSCQGSLTRGQSIFPLAEGHTGTTVPLKHTLVRSSLG